MPFNVKQLLLTLLISTFSFAQVEEINPPDFIKTITFKGDTPESQLPVIRLGEPLVLEFDALNGDEEDYYYEIKHYNFDWTPSILVESEYLSGFNKQRIRNYDNINNLKPQYTLANELIYRYTKESSFYAGNEFLYFENKDLRSSNTGVQFIDLKDLYNSYLYRNIPRHNLEYTYNPDINGNFVVTALNVWVTNVTKTRVL